MCVVCGNPRCGTVELLEQAAAPVTAAVVSLKAAGWKAIGVQAMPSKDKGLSVEELGKLAQEAHAAQHGVARANDNLPGVASPEPKVYGEPLEGGQPVVRGSVKAEDKAQKGPKD